MTPAQLAILHKHMDKAVDEISEIGNPHYVYPDMGLHMAKAAELIYEAAMAGQEFMETESE